MINQYKPSKPQKVKPAKPAKAAKPAKPTKAAPIGVGAATAVKIERPKKVKPPKAPKVPKAEKAQAVSIGKVQKAETFEGARKLKQPVSSKTLAAIAAGLVVIAAIVIAVVFLPRGNGNEPAVAPETLTVTAMPDKTVYYVGETAIFTGLKVEVTLSNGVRIPLDESEYEIIGFDSTAAEVNQGITVQYKELTAKFAITIKEKETSGTTSGKYSGLSFKTLPKTQYKVGEWLSADGGVLLVHYDDGSTREMELSHEYIYGFTTNNPGTFTLTVKYMEKGVYGETTYTITVTK